MTPFHFKCATKSHPLFGQVNRAIMSLDFYSYYFQHWFKLSDVLIDTGADLSVVPLRVGELLVPNIELGTPLHLGGAVLPEADFNAYVHTIRARLGTFQFQVPVAIALAQTPPIILGRLEALDRFNLVFNYGKEVIFTAREEEDQ